VAPFLLYFPSLPFPALARLMVPSSPPAPTPANAPSSHPRALSPRHRRSAADPPSLAPPTTHQHLPQLPARQNKAPSLGVSDGLPDLGSRPTAPAATYSDASSPR